MFWASAAIIVSGGAILVAAWFYTWVKALPTASTEIERIGALIRHGAFTFLKREYKMLGLFCAVTGIAIFLFLPHPIWAGNEAPIQNAGMLAAYLFGSALSALSGAAGISIATIANMRAASAAHNGIAPAFMAGFRGGAVMGMAVVATSLAGAALIFLIAPTHTDYVMSFSFGASSLALFAKAGGGIFTKTADIAADLTGKVELGIPEDDPRNPAVIADNVGDNVGDVAGMGADLFDSNVASIAAAIVIAAAIDRIELIFAFGALGLLSAITGVLFTRIGKAGDPGRALNGGTYLTCGLFALMTLLAALTGLFGEPNLAAALRLWGAAALGMAAGVVIGLTSDFFTGEKSRPVRRVAQACESGPAFCILKGISYGLFSCLPSMTGIGLAALVSYKLCAPLGTGYPMYGIAISAIGMLSVVGMIIANDAYGPIVDNARGLAEMCTLGNGVIAVADRLDAAGNTAKAITKGFAIGAAGLTVIALLGAFQETARSYGAAATFDLMDPLVFFGALVGAALPAVFSAMLIMGVGKNAERMVSEIRRQFREIPGLRAGLKGARPDYDRCIEIATTGALRTLVPAGLTAIFATLAVGLVGGVNAVGGYLTGNIVAGLLLALFMSNAGGLWDNAKKHIEAGNLGERGSAAHRAAVIGDTVGDPFKDTAGPSINTQITVVSLVSSLAASLFASCSLLG